MMVKMVMNEDFEKSSEMMTILNHNVVIFEHVIKA